MLNSQTMAISGKNTFRKIIIIDDSEVIRKRLFYILSELDEIKIIGEAANGSDGYELFTSLEPDIVILDIRMPGESGVTVLEKIKQKSPDTVVVMLTNYPYAAYRKRCRELGADYFLDKSTEFHKIKSVIENRYAADME